MISSHGNYSSSMGSLLYLQKCCRIPLFRVLTSARHFHSIFNDTHLLKSYSPASCQVRTFWESFPFIRPLYFEKDCVEREKYKLVYKAKIFNYAFYGQLLGEFALACQVFGGLFYAYQSYAAQAVVHTTTTYGPYVIHYNLPTLLIITLFMVQNMVLVMAAQKAVLRIYYAEELNTYKIVHLSLNPFVTRLYSVNPGALVPLKDSMMNIVFGNHQVIANHSTEWGKKMFIQSEQFKSSYFYNRLLADNYLE